MMIGGGVAAAVREPRAGLAHEIGGDDPTGA
jgi:hypothetical protein